MPDISGKGRYRRWMSLLLPFTRAEFPGWGRLLRAAGVMVPIWETSWDGAAARRSRGKLHGYEMTLHMDDWSERLTYFLGRYYELAVQETLLSVLRPGDRFVDVGANIGMISLVGAAAVGRSGCVDSFEPNPSARKRLSAHLEANDIKHATIHPVGLSDKAAKLTLNLTSSHSGTATLAAVDDEQVVESVEVDVVRGEDILLADTRPVRAIKIDVEGFELPALRGLRGLLERDRPFLITEFTPETMSDPAAEFAALVALLAPMGYRAFGLATRRRGLKNRTHLVTLSQESPPEGHPELLWCSEAALEDSGLSRPE